MKTLEQIKDVVAIKYGYESFEDFDDKSTFSYNHSTPNIIDEIAKLYVNQINSCENCGIRTSKYCEKCYDDASDSLPY